MSVTITKDSHVDHSLFVDLEAILKERFADKDGFFIETIELDTPAGLCALWGPTCGDDPVAEEIVDCVYYAPRAGRAYNSRMVPWAARESNLLTIIAGPHEGNNCVLYTAFAGRCAPKEVNDPSLSDEEREASERFWAEHALGKDIK